MHDGLVYSRPVGYRPLKLDLYVPGAPPAPLIVFVHGGGWLRGDRGTAGPAFAAWRPGFFERVVKAGFAIASVDYRLSGEATFPAQYDDVATAIDWLAEHGAEYGADAARPLLWGESAGAHLAALVALRAPAGRIAGVIDWYGPMDLASMPEADDADSRESRLLGAAVSSVPGLARGASPLTYVHEAAPPFLVAHGTADHLVPYRQSAGFAAALHRAGADVRLTPVEGATHMWRGLADPEPLFHAALDFAREITGR